ncbi:MAG: SRPBCC family protein [Gemmatimonadaceae bacterium]
MKLALVILGSIAGLVAIIAIVGALLPRDHVATLTARIAATPPAVWTVISSPEDFPAWRADVTTVDLLPATPTGSSWREHSRHGAITMVVDLAEPPRKMIARIADEGLPFGGKWTYEIEPDGDTASRVTITEAGSVSNPIFRFVSRFIMGHTASIDAYLRALGKRFGTEPTPTVVAGSHDGL